MNEQKIPKKIMIIDDDRFLLDMQATKFTKADMQVFAYTNAEEAISKIEGGEEVDVLLVDLIMPKMDGFQFLTKVKENNLLPNTVKIVFSNQSQQADVDKIKQLGIKHHLVKALYTPSEVLSKVLEIYNSEK
jgi:CheY-like chemotaxis protein